MFFVKLALRNLQKNQRAYLPYLISLIFLVAVNTMTRIIVNNPGMEKLPDSYTATLMFTLGAAIIDIFSVIFAIYTNSFLLKQRKNELGLYNILGLGKSELYKLLFWENFFSYLIVMVGGIISGLVLGKFGFLVLQKLMSVKTAFKFEVPVNGLLFVGMIFTAIFLVLYLINCWQIARTNPIELLHGTRKGEQEPKTRWISGILGFVLLAVGYYLALTIVSPLEAISKFFIAVILVIVGTYCLFDAGSILILKLLRQKESYYYQPNHFINIANMIYRMKQNAAGLASICILSTMVLVTVATTGSLYFGQSDMTDTRYSHDIIIVTDKEPRDSEAVVQDYAKREDLTIKNFHQRQSTQSLLFAREPEGFKVSNQMEDNMGNLAKATMMDFVTAAEYQKMTGKKMTLAPDEVALYAIDGRLPKKELVLEQEHFKIKKVLAKVKGLDQMAAVTDTFFVVFSDQQVIDGLLNKWYTTPKMQMNKRPKYTVTFDFETKRTDRIKVAEGMIAGLKPAFPGNIQFNSKDDFRESSKTFSGGFLFLGLMFGLIFTLATALIIYYKQVSEGLDDQERFTILQKVGMSHQEVKGVIHSQVLMVFAFPLIVAVLHLSAAFPLINKLLLLFGLVNWQLFLLITGLAVVSFALLYYLVYRITAKSYYQIVERRS